MESIGQSDQRHAGEYLWAGVPLFNALDAAALAAIGAHLATRPFAAGEAIIREGVWAGELFIIRSGIVQIVLESVAGPDSPASGAGIQLRRLVAGDPFGEMSLLTGTPPSATARALTDGTAWVLGQRDFLQLTLAHPQLSYNVNAILSERLARTSHQQMAEAPPQLTVIVGETSGPWLALAREVTRLSHSGVLLIDCAGRGANVSPTPTLTDLLTGHLRAGAATEPNTGGGALTAVCHSADDATAEPQRDLVATLGRLGANYQHTIILLPPLHPLLTAELLVYATRVLVTGEADRLPLLRRALAGVRRVLRTEAQPDLRALVYAAPVGLSATTMTLEALARELAVPIQAILPAAADRLAAAIAALARWLVGQRIGLAFGAGGAKGLAHLGVLRVLRRIGLPIDCVAGTSIGAIVGAGVAQGIPTDELAEGLRDGARRIFRPTFPLFSLLSNHGIARAMQDERLFGQRLIEHLPLPFAASAADLTEGREIVIRRGLVWRAILASAAIPGIFPPVKLGGHWLVDGGVVNPVPVSTVRLLGADLVIAIDLSVPLGSTIEAVGDARPAGWRPLLPNNIMRSRDIMMSEIRSHTAGEPALVIKPDVAGVQLLNFKEGLRLIAFGEQATELALPRLRALLPWLDTT